MRCLDFKGGPHHWWILSSYSRLCYFDAILGHSWWISLCLKIFIYFFFYFEISFFYPLKFTKPVNRELLFFFRNSKKFWNHRKKEYVNSLRKRLTMSIETVKFIILWISIDGYLILNSFLNFKYQLLHEFERKREDTIFHYRRDIKIKNYKYFPSITIYLRINNTMPNQLNFNYRTCMHSKQDRRNSSKKHGR